MLNKEQQQDLEKAIMLLFRLRNSLSVENWEEKRGREFSKQFSQKEALQKNLHNEKADDGAFAPPPLIEDNDRFLKFTEKELIQMPKKLRIVIRELGYAVYARKRTTGRYNCSYEIRFNRSGYKISASGSTKEEAKKRFIEKAKLTETQTDGFAPAIPADFDGFVRYWFDNFHKAKVKEKTYTNNLNLYGRHVKARLAQYKVKDITPAVLKDLLAALPGNGKTEDDVYSILNQIFDTAITHGLIKVNPIKLIPHIPHERESGVELTIDEELKLLTAYKGTVYEIIFSVILYAGLRPNEYKTARIENGFIVSVNSKQKTKKVEYKKIPICSHLRERLNGISELPTRHEVGIRDHFNRILPEHTLKDLRKTFNTRCIKCKVDFYAKEKFMGHTVSKLEKTYTGNLDDFLLTEGKKLDSWYSLYPKNTPNFND